MKLDLKEGNNEVDLKKMINYNARYSWIQMVTDIIGYIVNIFSPILIFIGNLIILVFNFLFNLFPDNFIWMYIILAIGLAVAGLYVNIKWSGLEYTSVFSKTREGAPQEPVEPPPSEPSEGYEPYYDD